jgi:uncharacterized protein YndB with AHSA1/START domain
LVYSYNLQIHAMIYKQWLSVMIFSLVTLSVHGQDLQNTSYINQSGEKVLRIEMTLPVDNKTAWELFTKDDRLKQWIAPVAHIELKAGGYILTNYNSNKDLSDSSSIRLPIIGFLDNELIVLKVILNDNFPASVRDSDENLQEIIQFKKLGNKSTRIISSMTGWKTGADWDKTYDFFVKGNEWTYRELLKNYK